MPVMDEDKNWEDLFKHLESKFQTADDFAAANAYFPHQKLLPYDGISAHNYMLQHVQRSVQTLKKGDGMKSFYNTNRLLVVHNHYGMRCLNNKKYSCTNKHISQNISQVNHYRHDVGKAFNVTSAKFFSRHRFQTLNCFIHFSRIPLSPIKPTNFVIII
jgi:hypothetical protein